MRYRADARAGKLHGHRARQERHDRCRTGRSLRAELGKFARNLERTALPRSRSHAPCGALSAWASRNTYAWDGPQGRIYRIATEDAQDLTQDFFVMILETNWLQHADPNRGRFRSLLLKSLQNFLVNAAERTQARKRGGDVQFVSWDDWMAEASSQLSISTQALDSLPPERLFDLRWAATVVEQALRRLREECEGKGKRRLFHALSSHLTAERDEVSFAQLSAALGVAETVVRKQLHIMRQRYRSLLRDEVAHTVENSADVEEEIRYLCA